VFKERVNSWSDGPNDDSGCSNHRLLIPNRDIAPCLRLEQSAISPEVEPGDRNRVIFRAAIPATTIEQIHFSGEHNDRNVSRRYAAPLRLGIANMIIGRR
jgi:hypothetical protein